jgi:hypothetical protein
MIIIDSGGGRDMLGLWVIKKPANIVMKGALIAFERQSIITVLGDDLALAVSNERCKTLPSLAITP